MEWQSLVPYIFGFMALAIAGWVANSIRSMSASMKEMSASVNSLNVQMAVLISQQSDHDRRLNRLENR